MDPDDVVVPSLPSLHEVGSECIVDYRWLYLAEVLKTKELRRDIEQLHIELLALKRRIQLLSTSRNVDSELLSDITSAAIDSELQCGAMSVISSNCAIDSAMAQKSQRQRIRSTRSQPNRRLITHNNLYLRSAAAASNHDWATEGLVRGITDARFYQRSDDEQTDEADASNYCGPVQGLAAPTEAKLPLTQAQVQCRSLLWDNDDNDDDDDDDDEVGVELPADNNYDATLLMRTKETGRDEGRLQSSIDRQARVQQLRRNARSNNHRKQPRSLNSTLIASFVLADIDETTVPNTSSNHPGQNLPSNSAVDLPKVGDHHHTINTHRYVSSSDSDEDDAIITLHHAPQYLPAIADSPLYDSSGRSMWTDEEELDNHIKRWASGKSIFQMLRSLREVSHASARILERAQVLPLVDCLSESAGDVRRVYL